VFITARFSGLKVADKAVQASAPSRKLYAYPDWRRRLKPPWFVRLSEIGWKKFPVVLSNISLPANNGKF
jgi:hypothetical protein